MGEWLTRWWPQILGGCALAGLIWRAGGDWRIASRQEQRLDVLDEKMDEIIVQLAILGIRLKGKK